MHLITYLDLLQTAEETPGSSYRTVSEGHRDDADVHWMTARLAKQCRAHAEALAPVRDRYGSAVAPAPERLHPEGLPGTRSGAAGLLRDLQDLYQLAHLVDVTWAMVDQAAHAVRDRELLDVAAACAAETAAQLAWLRMRMKTAAPQTLIVAQ